jgi:hypothetical protein
MRNIQRFWEKVEKTPGGCWNWKASAGSHGYGQTFDGKVTTAHRFSWKLAHGKYPDGWVLHRCNNRLCVNPDHLYEGGHMENMDDMARGCYHSKRKLTNEQARAIRESPLPQRTLAAVYGVTQAAISLVKRGITYRYA